MIKVINGKEVSIIFKDDHVFSSWAHLEKKEIHLGINNSVPVDLPKSMLKLVHKDLFELVLRHEIGHLCIEFEEPLVRDILMARAGLLSLEEISDPVEGFQHYLNMELWAWEDAFLNRPRLCAKHKEFIYLCFRRRYSELSKVFPKHKKQFRMILKAIRERLLWLIENPREVEERDLFCWKEKL